MVEYVIRGIADQTNLLAPQRRHRGGPGGRAGARLCGGGGRVRSLAGRTQQSTKEINEMLQRQVQISAGAEVKQAVEVMQASGARSRETVQEASHIASSWTAWWRRSAPSTT